MPVTVQIPDTSAFQEATLSTLFDPFDLIVVGDYVYACGGLIPGWIVRLNKSDLSINSTLNFPNDDKHKNPIAMVHANGVIYVLFRNSDTPDIFDYQLTIGTVTAGTSFAIGADFVNTTGVYLPQGGSITTDNTYLYACVWQPASVLRYRLTDANLTVLSLGALPQPSCIRYSSSKIYVGGGGWIARLSLALAIEQQTTYTVTLSQTLQDDTFAVSDSHLWLGNFSTDGLIKRILKSDLTVQNDIATGQLSRSAGVDTDETNIWELFENGRAARINPNTSEVSLYTVNPNQDYHQEIAGDGTYVFAASGLPSI